MLETEKEASEKLGKEQSRNRELTKSPKKLANSAKTSPSVLEELAAAGLLQS
jgi:hypothetical protein